MLLYEQETKKIIGAMIEVHTQLGCGFLEAVYQEALAIEFTLRKIPFEREKQLKLWYKGILLQKRYQADFVCFDKIIVETKATSALTSIDESQMINYLNVTDMKIGLLANFGQPSLVFKRFIH